MPNIKLTKKNYYFQFQSDLTPDIISMVEFFVNKLPIIQQIITYFLLLIGLGLVIIAFIKFISPRWHFLTISVKSKQSAVKIENTLKKNAEEKVENNIGLTQV